MDAPPNRKEGGAGRRGWEKALCFESDDDVEGDRRLVIRDVSLDFSFLVANGQEGPVHPKPV